MKISLSLTCVFLGSFASPLLAQAARIAVPNTDPNSRPGANGAAVVALGDWLASSTPDYAVSAPFDTTGGPQAGLIRIYNGADGTIARTATGTGFSTSCAGISVGDQLGTAMTAIDDCDADGKSELLATRRGASLPVGGCQQAGHGGFMIVFSNPATSPFVFTEPTTAGLGVAVARIDPSGGLPQFVVSTASGAVQVWRRSATAVTPVLVSTVSGFGQIGGALCGAGTVSGVAAFAVDGPSQVFIKNIAGTTLGTIAGPLGTGFGASLAFFTDTTVGDCIVIGEPAFGGGAGRVHLASIAGATVIQTKFGFGSDQLGRVVAAGGDVNADGRPDFLASTAGGNQAIIVNGSGVQAARPIILPISPAFARMSSMAISPDMTSDGFADVILGEDPAGGRSWVYFGGPEAQIQVVGSSCAMAGGLAPTLAMNAVPIVGTAPSFGLFGSTPNSFSGLLAGFIDPSGGTVIPPSSCLVFLMMNPTTAFTIFTDPTGAWVSAPVSIPRLLGSKFGFQGATVSSASGNPLEFSNALDLTIGW